MNAVELIRQMHDLGIRLRLRNDKLLCTALPGAITDDVKRALALHKNDIVALLSGHENPGSGDIPRSSRESDLPLSFAQQRIWFLHQLDPADPSYNIPGALKLIGEFDFAAFRRAIEEIVRRHESLRTTFSSSEGVARQTIAERFEIALPIIDLSHLPPEIRDFEVRQWLEEDAHRPFELSSGPLIRVATLNLGTSLRSNEPEHIVVFTLHHIVSDGWSRGVLMDEFVSLYAAFVDDRPSPLPELPVQYADYAEWQRRRLSGAFLDRELAYWRDKLAGAPSGLDLPTDYPRPSVRSHRGANHEFSIPEDLSNNLNSLARREGATAFEIFVAAFQILLSRHSGQTDFCIGTPVANRGRPELDGMIGILVDTLVLRSDLSGDPTFIDFLRQVHETTIEAKIHQELPFERLVEELRPIRDMGRPPLFQVMFAYQRAPTRAMILPRLRIEPISLDNGAAKFDITLSLIEKERGLEGSIEYSTDLFGPLTVERFARRYVELLKGIVTAPQSRIGDLPMLDAFDARRILVDWNDTGANFPLGQCLHEPIEAVAAASPHSIAVIHGDAALSYGELNAKANRLARRLVQIGVGPEKLVGLCAERSVKMVIAILAILKAGGAYLPLDPDYPPERLAYVIDDARPLVTLVQDHLRALLPSCASMLTLDDDISEPGTEPGECDLGRRATPHNPAYVIYTSGSTGRPKGVVAPHVGVVNRIEWMQERFGLSSDDVVFQKTPFSFDVSVWEFFWPLRIGARLVVAAPGDHREPARLTEVIARERVTTLHFVPSMLRAFLETAECGRLKSLTRVLCSGEELSADLRDRFYRSLSAELYNLYGPTEASIDVSSYACRREDEDLNVPIGRPIWNTQLFVLDKGMRPVPQGCAGELFIGGVSLARGYLNRPDLTAERFLPHPFGAMGERLYRTGDLVRHLADGSIIFVGRVDHQVKIRGFRIELAEIEAALLRISGVKEAVVTTHESRPGEKSLVAHVVQTVNAELTASTLRASLARELPDYMTPTSYVLLDSLPLTASGKIDRKALPAPDIESQITTRYVAPSTPLEESLCRSWAEILGLERVGVKDNFFELGGHSLLAVRLVERMRRDGVAIDVRTLFIAPTIAGVAQRRASEASGRAPPNEIPSRCDSITPTMLPLIEMTQSEIDRIVYEVPGGAAAIADIYPLTPLQEGILFHHLASADGDAYLLQTLLSFDRRDRVDSFTAALQALIERHDILRTAFVWEGLREPAQVVWRRAPFELEDVALTPSDGDCAEQMRIRFHPSRHRIDMRRPPLMRAFVAYDPAENRWLVALLAHHIVMDHATREILLEEARHYLSGDTTNRAASSAFRDFVHESRIAARNSDHTAFFTKMLGDVTEPTAPFGLLNVQGDGAGVVQASVDLAPELARRLRRNARDLRIGVASLFHLAFALVLARVTGRDDVVFGTVLLGRLRGGDRRAEALGLLINTLPLRFRLADIETRNGAQLMHEALTELLRHEHVALSTAQRCSAVPPPIPLFSALLNYRHSVVVDEASGAALRGFDGMKLLHSEERSNYPFVLSVDDFGDEFRLTAQVDSMICPVRACSFMLAALEGLSQSFDSLLVADLRTLDVLPEAERHRLLVEWNDTDIDYPNDRSIAQLFEEQAELRPDSSAVVFESGRLTYDELNARANRVAHRLVSRGVGPEVIVGICAERSVETIVGLLAIAKAGGAYLPLDPTQPRDRLDQLIVDARPLLALAPEHLRDLLPDELETLSIDGERPDEDDYRGNLASRVTSENLAYVIYTSGSTGRPKGVAVTHRNVARLVRNADYAELGPDQTILHCAPLAFDASTFEIWGALLNGGRLAIAPPGAPLSLDELRRVLREQAVTTLWLTASLFHHIVDVGLDALAGVRQLLTGGDVVSAKHAAAFCDAFPSARLVNGYGPTENTTFSTFHRFAPESDVASIPIGEPIANSRAYILGRDLEPAPIGVVGELYAGGDGLARGYWGRPDLTADRFIPAPFGDVGERLYRTGDLAVRREDGNIIFMRRVDHQVKIRGFRVELAEIEASLMRIETIREAVVVADDYGDGERRLIAYATTRDRSALRIDELRSRLTQLLPDYMIPSRFVVLESMPLTVNGKIDRKALPAPNAQPRHACLGPRTVVEQVIAREFEETLGVHSIGIDDNFFHLGGNSLSGVKLIERLRSTLCGDLPVTAIFRAPTIAQLSSLMIGREDMEQSCLVPMQRGPEDSTLFCAHPAGGSIARYRALASALGGVATVVGIQSRGLLGSSQMDESLEEMATRYVEAIRRRQPHGPYHLLGWSMGGFTAFDMASILERSGERVAFLGILDTQFVAERADGDQASVLDYLRRFAAVEGVEIDDRLSEADEEELRDGGAALSDRERYVHAALWGQEHGFWRNVSADLMNFVYSDRQNALKMIRGLRLPRIEAPLHVWWASETLEKTGKIPIDWRGLTIGEVHSEMIEGTHDRIVDAPGVHAKVRAILQSLRNESRAESTKSAGVIAAH
jgi:amino acid adenylation domain-containing protein